MSLSPITPPRITAAATPCPQEQERLPVLLDVPLIKALQGSVARAMHGRSGSLVVLDVESNQLLAFYHLDTAGQRLVLPGSAIKPFTLLALFESKRLKADDTFLCPRKLTLGGRKLDCVHPPLAAPIRAQEALAISCNAFFAQMSLRLTDEELTRYFERVGFGTSSGYAGKEVSGRVRRSASPEKMQLKAIGEDDIEVTPLGLLAAYRYLALHRTRVAMQAPEYAALHGGLTDVVRSGTGKLAAAPGLDIEGKTGTARAAEGAWRHGWFAGFAPAERPEIVLVVFLERGTGPADAAPIAGEIFRAYAEARRMAPVIPGGRQAQP